MATGWSEKVRQIADREFVQRSAGPQVSIRLGDLKAIAKNEGFPSGHIEQLATAIESEKFWKTRGLRLISPRGQSRRVDTLIQFQVLKKQGRDLKQSSRDPGSSPMQDPLLALAGTIKHAFAEGAEEFIRDIRRDKDWTS